MEYREGFVRWGWALSLLSLAILLGGTYYLDRQSHQQLEARRAEAASEAEREASDLSEDLAAEVANRIGALAAAKVQFTQLEDSLSQRAFVTAVDSVIGRLPGLTAVSVIYPDGGFMSSPAAILARQADPLSSPELADAYGRARDTRRPTSTAVIDVGGDRRFIVFDPVAPSDTAAIQAVLAAELEPRAILQAALDNDRANLRPLFYDLYDPEGRRITTVPAPEGWPQVRRGVRVADTEWGLFVAHQPVNERGFAATHLAIRIAGVLLAVGFSALMLVLWRMVVAQQGEIGLRRRAEEEARAVTEQLRSAQAASLRLSGTMDPDRVIDEFLGVASVEIGAEVGRIYDFEDNGEVLVGRRIVVLDPTLAEEGNFSQEKFRQVRLPAALMPHLAEPVATGEPYVGPGDNVVSAQAEDGRSSPTAILTVPLAIGGHLVGLAVWESYRPDAAFDDRAIPFAQAVTAHAAAALRAADLMDGVQRARQRARREAVRLATVLDQMGDAVVLFDEEGNPQRVNPAAEAMLGPVLHETSLQDWNRVFHISDSTGMDGRFVPARALEGRTVRDARVTVNHRGLERYLSVSAAPIRGSDDVVRGAAVVLRDVTAEHEYAEMLRHTNQELRQQAELLERTNDELRAATAAKDQFLAMMSHELRTPINAIIGYSDLLNLGVHGNLNDKQGWMLGRVTDTSRHLLGLIEDVLDLAKIGAGRIDLDIEEISLAPVLERATTQVLPLASEKRLEIHREGDADLQVMADETRLLQILINLCSNAVKFTEEGSVTIHTRTAKYHALVTVQDTGPGIPDEQIETIFEEFHQVDSGLSRKAGGSGLGLTISRRLARLMGGDVTVNSEAGEGTEFTVHIPLAAKAADGDAAPQDSRPAAPGGDADRPVAEIRPGEPSG